MNKEDLEQDLKELDELNLFLRKGKEREAEINLEYLSSSHHSGYIPKCIRENLFNYLEDMINDKKQEIDKQLEKAV